jgi:hypothetical protein
VELNSRKDRLTMRDMDVEVLVPAC